MAIITGDGGPNVLIGTNLADEIRGQGGGDRISGRGGNDFLMGGSGNDLVGGEAGNDIVRGDDGNDTVNGGDGNDNINGGRGRDLLNGGNGEDNYDFNSVQESNGSILDTIANFDFGAVDTIDVSSIDADQRSFAGGNQDFFFNGTSDGGAGSIWVTDISGGRNLVVGNVDDDPTAEFQVVVNNGIPAEFWADFNFVL